MLYTIARNSIVEHQDVLECQLHLQTQLHDKLNFNCCRSKLRWAKQIKQSRISTSLTFGSQSGSQALWCVWLSWNQINWSCSRTQACTKWRATSNSRRCWSADHGGGLCGRIGSSHYSSGLSQDTSGLDRLLPSQVYLPQATGKSTTRSSGCWLL